MQKVFSSPMNGYGYDPDNRRVYKAVWTWNGSSWNAPAEEISYFAGQKLSSYTLTATGGANPSMTLTAVSHNVYFGSRLIRKVNADGTVTAMQADRLGSFGKYAPYGEQRDSYGSGDNTEKFATYYRDAGTGLDYAVNRYYNSASGRFTTADPYRASAGAEDPGSWNRYGYVGGDPANYQDRDGRLQRPASYCETFPSDPLCDDSPMCFGCFSPDPPPPPPAPKFQINCQITLAGQSIITDGVPFYHTVVTTAIRLVRDGKVVATITNTYEGIAVKKEDINKNCDVGGLIGSCWLNSSIGTALDATAFAGMSALNTLWQTDSAPDLCGYVENIQFSAATYQNNRTSYQYLPMPFVTANSNSWTYTLLHRAGFSQLALLTWLAPSLNWPIQYPGWGQEIIKW